MGMGDKPKTFIQSKNKIRDDVIGKEFAACAVRPCPEPHVIKRFGLGGIANVSIYTCRKCKYHSEHPLGIGVKCDYGVGDRVSPGEKS